MMPVGDRAVGGIALEVMPQPGLLIRPRRATATPPHLTGQTSSALGVQRDDVPTIASGTDVERVVTLLWVGGRRLSRPAELLLKIGEVPSCGGIDAGIPSRSGAAT